MACGPLGTLRVRRGLLQICGRSPVSLHMEEESDSPEEIQEHLEI